MRAALHGILNLFGPRHPGEYLLRRCFFGMFWGVQMANLRRWPWISRRVNLGEEIGNSFWWDSCYTVAGASFVFVSPKKTVCVSTEQWLKRWFLRVYTEIKLDSHVLFPSWSSRPHENRFPTDPVRMLCPSVSDGYKQQTILSPQELWPRPDLTLRQLVIASYQKWPQMFVEIWIYIDLRWFIQNRCSM